MNMIQSRPPLIRHACITEQPGQVTCVAYAPILFSFRDMSFTLFFVSALGSGSISSNAAHTGTVMYQTPQGVVYATPTTAALSALPEGYILNLPQTPTAISLGQGQTDASGQQYITIPVPVSLASAQVNCRLDL